MKKNVWENDVAAFIKKHPQFKVGRENNLPTLEGKIELEDENGFVLNRFDVKMVVPSCYPYCFPRVWEISNKIPHDIDWHVVPGDNYRLCIAVRPEEKLKCLNGINLDWFLENALIPYLARQAYRLKNPERGYPNGERPHGTKGIVEFYFEVLQSQSLQFVRSTIENVINGVSYQRNDSCFCESGKKFKKCHMDGYSKLRQLGESYLIAELNELKSNL